MEPSPLAKKILRGMEIAYERMIEFKIYKNSKVVLWQDGKVVEIDPRDLPKTTRYGIHRDESENSESPR
ncbi:MAG: hypothetical protein AAF998_23105 [Bacteroidota bacterium]